MSQLDTAYLAAKQDHEQKSQFYQLFLNTELYIATQQAVSETETQTSLSPLLVESHGTPYIMLFDSEQRLQQWAQKDMHFAVLPGHVIVEIMSSQHPWALNVGTEYSKAFVPAEIDWLKQCVIKTKQQQAEAQQGVSMLVRAPQDLSGEFNQGLRDKLASYPQIQQAYLGVAHYAIQDEPPHLTLVLALNSPQDTETLRTAIQQTATELLDNEQLFDVLLSGESAAANEIAKSMQPFYPAAAADA